MNSTIFISIMNRYRNVATNVFVVRGFSSGRYVKSNLYSRISPLGDPGTSVAPVLDKWVEEGKKVNDYEIQRIIRDLRSRKRFEQALEVSEWMSSKGICQFVSGNRAVLLDLIGHVHGLESAESYFNNLSEKEKSDKLYGALLNCYVREGLIEKSLSHFQKMKEMGFASSPLNYNGIMCLYTHAGQHEKIPDVLSEMKNNCVSPDNFSYRICMNSYGARSDLIGMEKILQEMEREPHITMDWNTYALVSSYYVKAGLKEKALLNMKKCEQKILKDPLGYNQLISLYASLGNKDEMMRLWYLEKSKCKKQINRDYITMLGSLVKLGEFEEIEKLLEEWESSNNCYDFRVPNILLIGYSQKGMIEKAEEMLEKIIGKGKTPTPNSWAIVASGYLDKQDIEKALVCMKKALAVHEQNKGWRPKAEVISSLINWLGDNGDVEEVETFISSLKIKVPMSQEMYHALIKAYIRSGKEVDGIVESMKGDKIDPNEETERILSHLDSRLLRFSLDGMKC